MNVAELNTINEMLYKYYKRKFYKQRFTMQN